MLSFLSKIKSDGIFIWTLVKNELRERYLGNVLGISWAFIQPIVTIAILWFVFQVGFKSKPVGDFPFILWLGAGMFPWFFISEAILTSSGSVISNVFLVKKIVFRVNLLPIISIATSLVIHVFFIFVMFIMFLYYGYEPNIYWVQIIYYLFASVLLLVGMGWFISSIVVFFKDVGQLVSVIVQLGFWITPIFWSINIIPIKYHWILKLNPITYIIDGYRNSMIDHMWFWQEPKYTIYFWIVTLLFLFVGYKTFNKLKPHYADVL